MENVAPREEGGPIPLRVQVLTPRPLGPQAPRPPAPPLAFSTLLWVVFGLVLILEAAVVAHPDVVGGRDRALGG